MTPINQQITSFLDYLGYKNYVQLEPNRWEVTIVNDDVDFAVEICLIDSMWISFTSIMMTNLQGRNLAQFYELLIRLNSYLNGFKFGITPDGAYVTVQAEWSQDGIDIDIFSGILQQFTLIYSNWYPTLTEKADELSLKFRKLTKKNSFVDSSLQELTDISIWPALGGVEYIE